LWDLAVGSEVKIFFRGYRSDGTLQAIISSISAKYKVLSIFDKTKVSFRTPKLPITSNRKR
jgi:hypothetical protein